ncbi:hypothetical protein [Desertimonas flava]|uniref:hypothetical protein n=1 Tax=Desertimonas flava TaxID=2064846 RepID=UPI000E34B118|nr:hypothetical protein [Desertimonas flava]
MKTRVVETPVVAFGEAGDTATQLSHRLDGLDDQIQGLRLDLLGFLEDLSASRARLGVVNPVADALLALAWTR